MKKIIETTLEWREEDDYVLSDNTNITYKLLDDSDIDENTGKHYDMITVHIESDINGIYIDGDIELSGTIDEIKAKCQEHYNTICHNEADEKYIYATVMPASMIEKLASNIVCGGSVFPFDMFINLEDMLGKEVYFIYKGEIIPGILDRHRTICGKFRFFIVHDSGRIFHCETINTFESMENALYALKMKKILEYNRLQGMKEELKTEINSIDNKIRSLNERH